MKYFFVIALVVVLGGCQMLLEEPRGLVYYCESLTLYDKAVPVASYANVILEVTEAPRMWIYHVYNENTGIADWIVKEYPLNIQWTQSPVYAR